MRVYIFYGIVFTENRAENPTEIDSAREKDEEELPNGRIADGERRGKGEQQEVEEAVVATAATTMEETEEGERRTRERDAEGLRYITRQLPDATVRTNCARGT